MRVMNVPNINDKTVGIKVTVNAAGDYQVSTTDRWNITEVSGHSKESTASDIQSLLQEFLKIGFEQGRTHVRTALGL